MAEGVPEKHVDLLRAHFEAPGRKRTARQLAEVEGPGLGLDLGLVTWDLGL